MIKIATYNINSVRLRAERVKKLLIDNDIDILCLQETKVTDDKFPVDIFKDAGYEHIYFRGEKSYNGVAFISRIPLTGTCKENFVNNSSRHISAHLPNGTELHNFYIPAGGDEPDPNINPKFDHKLKFFDAMTDYFSNKKKSDSIIIVGDFNVAPFEHDVWSHKQLLKVVSHTPIEVEKMNNLTNTLDFIDCSRHFIPDTEKLYSWWSYRNRDWRKSNRGRRLDHIWITPPLLPSLKNSYILQDERDGDKPSDHVPVIIELAL